MARSAEIFQQYYQQACLLELRALKPGNVGYHSDGHGMTVNHFESSANASAVPLFTPSLDVGGRILAAVQATQAAVADNTNLGIILLVAPIAETLLAYGYNDHFRGNLAKVLANLSIEDAKHCYKAIQLAMPGGMGEVDQQDISSDPNVSLLEAMRLAAEHDRIAYLYTHDYEDIFEHNLPIYREYKDKWGSSEWAATAVFLSQWLRVADSLIIRKKGILKAREISDMIAPLANQVLASSDPAEYKSGLLSLDGDLKNVGINPGTTADITVATLFVAILESASIRDEL